MDNNGSYGMQATPFGFMNTGFNPYQRMNQYQPQSQFQPHGFIRVNGIDGAKRFEMGPNQAVPLFDENDDVFFVKTTDGAGFPTLRRFRFFEETEQVQPANDYVTRQEFNNTLQQLKEAIENGKQSVRQSATAASEPNAKQDAGGDADA